MFALLSAPPPHAISPAPETENPGLSLHSGGRIRTCDLRVMRSPHGALVRSGCPCLLGLARVRWGRICSKRNLEWNPGAPSADVPSNQHLRISDMLRTRRQRVPRVERDPPPCLALLNP